jgi:large subunit ribosomal protein L4
LDGEDTHVQLQVHNISGEEAGQVELSDLVFGIEPNRAVMHQALVRQQANARAGTHSTLTRSDVSGGGKKPWRQKGTGRARQGSIRAPQWRGGGVVFGPHPRSYKQAMPRKMRRLAIRSALSQKVLEGRLRIVQGLAEIEPRAKAMEAALHALGVRPEGALVATNGRVESVERAGGNLVKVRVIHASNLNMADLLKYEYLLLAREAVEPVQRVLLDGVRQAAAPEAAAPVEAPAAGEPAFTMVPVAAQPETGPANEEGEQ